MSKPIIKKPNEIVFISRILRDGSGVVILTNQENEDLQKSKWEKEYLLMRLSMSQDTYIACGFNSYVVKLKQLTAIF